MTNGHGGNDALVEINGVSKKFSKSLRDARRYGLKKLVAGAFGVRDEWNTLRPGQFWAVDDVSFTVEKGETLGIIGRNGAGKSTILKMINGLYLPDKGEITVKGSVGALIELGAGFHPLLTGRENIYIKGAMFGKRKREVDELFDQIVEFADLGDFIDSPVGTYSSGMYIRLGFAVAIYNDPDIMLVDEILAVGDYKFKQKCFSKINELKRKTAFVFVSHSMLDITRFCDRVVVLDRGKLAYLGSPVEGVKFYLDEVENREIKERGLLSDDGSVVRSFFGELFSNNDKITDVNHRWVTAEGKPADSIKHNDTLILEFSFRLLYKPHRIVIGVPIWDEQGNYITSVNSDVCNAEVKVDNDGWVKGRMTIEHIVFNPGVYASVISIVDSKEMIYRQVVGSFRIQEIPFYFGFVTIQADWDFA
ncbi:MAG: ATP-binding cassette domain-containing protein [Deltaproteobacteria bacterium]|nr:ATP-binding cassette domain-containing protein [Candidatus Zymogenaceae bacterium]